MSDLAPKPHLILNSHGKMSDVIRPSNCFIQKFIGRKPILSFGLVDELGRRWPLASSFVYPALDR